MENLSKAAITSIAVVATSRNVVLYAGDAKGWVRVYSREGIIMRQIKASPITRAAHLIMNAVVGCGRS